MKTLLVWLLLSVAAYAGDIRIVMESNAPEPVKIAGRDLEQYLQRMYPNAGGKTVRLVSTLPTPEGYEITATESEAVIAGGGALGVVYGVYALLERLGCGFLLTGDVVPPARSVPLSFKDWSMSNQPLVGERLVFNWHNFLSGCSSWNLADWQRWADQSQKMGYNAIMVHAYGNNPMATFDYQGVTRPAGFLATTEKGRDWRTMHVNDVRRLSGGTAFDGPVFGSDAAMVPESQHVAAAQSLMQEVFRHAAQRGMGIYFAMDVDTPSANLQETVRLLPVSARFEAPGSTRSDAGKSPPRVWIANPDTPEGYDFFRHQVAALMKTYPQITTLVPWFRVGSTPWTELKTTDLPVAWQNEFAAETVRSPAAKEYWHATGLFAIGKLVGAYQRALKDCGATQTRVAAGSWCFNFLPAADRFFPQGVPLIALDYNISWNDAKARAKFGEVAAHRNVTVVTWAQHDDFNYMGRPLTPFPDFYSKLADAHATGFGVIHWTTRPLDLFFQSHSRQVWQNTRDESLRATCDHLAARLFGGPQYGEYLSQWATNAPVFGTETQPRFVSGLRNASTVASNCQSRVPLLAGAQGDLAGYFKGLECFMADFFRTQDAFQRSEAALKSNDLAQARQLLAQCHPEAVLEQFAKCSSIGGITRGEQGLLISMNLRWLTYVVYHRQALGVEPVRIKFGPTQHEELAQLPGKYSFYFGPDKSVWECLGEEESGAPAFTAPEAADELARTGIEIHKPFTFTLRPIMSKSAKLRAGAYLLRLWVTAPLNADIEVAGAKHHADLAGPTGMVELSYPLAIAAPGVVPVTVSGEAKLYGAILEPVKLTEELPAPGVTARKPADSATFLQAMQLLAEGKQADAAKLIDAGWAEEFAATVRNSAPGPYLPGSWGTSRASGDKVLLFIRSWQPGMTMQLPNPEWPIQDSTVKALTGGKVRLAWAIGLQLTMHPAERDPVATVIEYRVRGDATKSHGVAVPDWMDPSLNAPPESVSDWRQLKFGMFVHWGPCSILGREIGWGRNGSKMGRLRYGGAGVDGAYAADPVYDELFKKFTLSKFQAEDWAALAKAAGMQYMVPIMKHHDGFCLFGTKASEYTILATPYGKDAAGELADACHKAGLKIGWYYSPRDWYDRNFGRVSTHDEYCKTYFSHLTELCSKYGKIDVLWLDCLDSPQYIWKSTPEDSIRLIRKLQPGIMINDRGGLPGDFSTPEGRVGDFDRERPWESCISICSGWSWHPNAKIHPLKTVIQQLVNTVGRDGNLLLNVPPTADGDFEPEKVTRLKEIGAWLTRNGESIYATRGGPFLPNADFVSTCKGKRVYLHLLNQRSKVVLPSIKVQIRKARLLNGREVQMRKTDRGTVISLPAAAAGEIDRIIVLEFDKSTESMDLTTLLPGEA
jgi:hypothetical protein